MLVLSKKLIILKSLQRLIYFFSSKYYNNLKFNNRMLTKTRIFFERTTKMNLSLNNLGAVYRNSKWTDLNINNIQKNSIRQMTRLFGLCFIIFVIVFLSFRFNFISHSEQVLENLAILRDTSTSWLSFAFCSLAHLVARIAFYFINLLFPSTLTLGTPLQTTKVLKTAGASSTTTSTITSCHPTPLDFCHYLTSTVSLQRLVKNLHVVSKSLDSLVNNKNSFMLGLTKLKSLDSISKYPYYHCSPNFIPLMLFLESTFNCNMLSPNTFYTPSVNAQFYDLKLNNKTFYPVLTSFNLQNMQLPHVSLLTQIITQNLRLGKEQKWLLKQTLLSSELILNTHKYTQLKNAYGCVMWSTYTRDKNIWFSMRTHDTSLLPSNSTPLSNALSFSKLPYFSINNLANINYLEESIFWLTKRFKLTQALSTNLQYTEVLHQPTFYILHQNNLIPAFYLKAFQQLNLSTFINPNNMLLFLPNDFMLIFLTSFSSNLTISNNTVFFYSNLELE